MIVVSAKIVVEIRNKKEKKEFRFGNINRKNKNRKSGCLQRWSVVTRVVRTATRWVV